MTYPRNSSAFGPAASPRFPEIERETLEFWKSDDTFRASIEQREGETNWSSTMARRSLTVCRTTATCSPGTSRTLVPRFQTMRGKQGRTAVFGWDTHGLPAELEAMKQLGMTDKKRDRSMGIDMFNAQARTRC